MLQLRMHLIHFTRLFSIYGCAYIRIAMDYLTHFHMSCKASATSGRSSAVASRLSIFMQTDIFCVMQTGYNLLYGCWKYSWDADCELFLKILRGEVKEEVYVEQIQLQVTRRCVAGN